MVQLGIDVSAFEFHQGVRAIELMWVAGCLVLDQQAREATEHLSEFQRLSETDRLPDAALRSEEDSFDEGDRIRLELMAIEEARIELNNATVISLYHHWERFVPSDEPTQIRSHRKLLKDARSAQIGLHSEIGALVSSANYLKHGNPKRLAELEASFAARFPSLRYDIDAPAWLRRLKLTDDHVQWMFEIVKASQRPIVS